MSSSRPIDNPKDPRTDEKPVFSKEQWAALDPVRIECVALVADPFRPELPTLAAGAALHQQLLLLQSRPVRRG